MDVVFPDFADPLLMDLSVCAFVEDRELLARFPERVKGDTKYGEEHWARIMIGPRKKLDETQGVHLHLDFKRSFGPEKKPPTLLDDQFRQRLDEFAGKSVKGLATARYVLPNTELPEDGFISAIRGVSFISSGEGSLTLTGGTLQYSGEGYDEVKWRAVDDTKTEIFLDAFVSATVDNNYVIEAVRFLREGLTRFVL